MRPSLPPTDWSLQPGQQASWAANVGDELFCASGSVRVDLAGTAIALPARVLCAGQALRAPAAGVFRAEGVVAGRGRLVPAPQAAPAPPQKRESPGPYGLGLSWMGK